MGERVETGGLMSFDYSRTGRKNEMSREEKKEISEAYGKYYDRKRRERKRKIIMWIVIVLVILLVILGVLFFR